MTNHIDNFVILPNSIYDSLDITNEELTVLILLYRNYVQYKYTGVCSIQLLADYMMVDTSNNRRLVNTLKEAVISLVDKGYILKLYDVGLDEISVSNPIKNKYFPFQYELVPFSEDNFFMINDTNIIHIFKQLKGINISKFNIIRYYIACCRVSNNDSNFGYLTQGKLKQLISDSRTIQRYNKILQDDLHLIRYNNSYLTPDKHYCTTFIGKYDDKKNFNNQLQIAVESQGLIHTDKIKSNVKRSVKQKINNADTSDKAKIRELEEQLKKLQYKEVKKKDETIKNVKSLGKPKHLPIPVIEDDEPNWDDTDEEDTSCIDINALLDEM